MSKTNPEVKSIGKDVFLKVESSAMWRKLYGPDELKPIEASAREWHERYLGGQWLPDAPAKTEKKRRPRLIAWVNESCTGCENCIPFCPVDCIQHTPRPLYPTDHSPTKTVMIRYDECIGCELCAKACDSANAGYNAIFMVTTDSFEEEHEIEVSDDLVQQSAEEYHATYQKVVDGIMRNRETL